MSREVVVPGAGHASVSNYQNGSVLQCDQLSMAGCTNVIGDVEDGVLDLSKRSWLSIVNCDGDRSGDFCQLELADGCDGSLCDRSRLVNVDLGKCSSEVLDLSRCNQLIKVDCFSGISGAFGDVCVRPSLRCLVAAGRGTSGVLDLPRRCQLINVGDVEGSSSVFEWPGLADGEGESSWVNHVGQSTVYREETDSGALHLSRHSRLLR